MAVTGTKTVRDLVVAALRKAGVTDWADQPHATEAEMAASEMNLMFKGWQNRGYNLWTKASATLPLVAGQASYTLTPVRPLRILSARYWNGSSELPLQELTRDEYDTLPVKAAAGIPTTFHYDRQREAAALYVWPVLWSVIDKEIRYTYEREIEDVANLNDAADIPGEWWECAVYGLAVRLAETSGVAVPPTLFQRAEILLREAGAFDREGSVFFAGEF